MHSCPSLPGVGYTWWCSGTLMLSCLDPLLYLFDISQALGADFNICNCENKYIDELMPQNKAYTRKVSLNAELFSGRLECSSLCMPACLPVVGRCTYVQCTCSLLSTVHSAR